MPNHFIRGKFREEDRVIGPSLEALDNALDVLAALPNSDAARFFTVEHHRRIADEGTAEDASRHLFFDAYNWLKFFWWTSAFKMRQLGAGLVWAYNNDNWLSWTILGRSSIEYAAVSYYFAKQINQLRLQGPVFTASGLQALETLVQKYIHGTRFNWTDLLAGNREALTAKFIPEQSSAAVQVMTAIDHLARRDDRYRDVRIGYEMLSDFVHPNMASHASVVEMPEAPGDLHECLLAATPGPLRGEFFAVVTLPWVSLGVGTTVELLVELAPLMERWLDFIDGKEDVTVDFSR